jgi:hypothetical protein
MQKIRFLIKFMTSIYWLLTFDCTFKNKIEFANYWNIVFVILLFVSKFLVVKAEHTVANYNGGDFTSQIATVY